MSLVYLGTMKLWPMLIYESMYHMMIAYILKCVYVVSHLNWDTTCEWYMARVVVKNGHPRNTRHNEILLRP